MSLAENTQKNNLSSIEKLYGKISSKNLRIAEVYRKTLRQKRP